MKVKVKVNRPKPPVPTVTIEVSEACAHIIRLSMGMTVTGHLEGDPASIEHYSLFKELGRKLLGSPYKATKDDNNNIRIERR